jgi:hypothetical protein
MKSEDFCFSNALELSEWLISLKELGHDLHSIKFSQDYVSVEWLEVFNDKKGCTDAFINLELNSYEP